MPVLPVYDNCRKVIFFIKITYPIFTSVMPSLADNVIDTGVFLPTLSIMLCLAIFNC